MGNISVIILLISIEPQSIKHVNKQNKCCYFQVSQAFAAVSPQQVLLRGSSDAQSFSVV